MYVFMLSPVLAVDDINVIFPLLLGKGLGVICIAVYVPAAEMANMVDECSIGTGEVIHTKVRSGTVGVRAFHGHSDTGKSCLSQNSK